MSINEKVEFYELEQNIAQGCLTNSKHPDRFINTIYPHVISHGHKCHLYDLNGKKYLDFICGLGTNLFGYGNEKIKKKMLESFYKGECHSFPTKWEIIAAKKIKELFPWVEKVKFVNDGSSACSAALTIARTYQQYFNSDARKVVLSEGYHGWHAEYTSLTPPANGVLNHNNIQQFKSLYEINPKRVGAIIIEPVMLCNDKKRKDFLRKLRDYCTQHDIVLIFDETITALRYPSFSVTSDLHIEPDLLIFGKALGNGEKIACIAGKSSIMEGEYFVSGTYHGHTPSLISASMTLHLIKYDNDYDVEYLNDEGEWFQDEFNKRANPLVGLKGYGSRGVFVGDETAKAIFWQEMCKAGVLFGPSFFINWDLIPYFNDVLYLTERIIEKIKNGSVVLEGQAPTAPFSQKARVKL